MFKIKKNLGLSTKMISLLVFCGGIIFLFSGCLNKTPETVTTDFIMYTFIEYKLYGKNSDKAVKEMSKRLREFEDMYSVHKDESYVSLINKNAGKTETELPKYVYGFIKKATIYSQATKGNFDLTVAPLTLLWNVTGENPKVPSQQEIAKAKALVNCNDVILNDSKKTVMLKNEGQEIDLGGIAKGESANIIFEVAKEYEIEKGYVSIGGNLVVLGTDPNGKDYRFGIRDPLGNENEFIGTVSITGKTMSTSGGYERFFEQDGKIYTHIFDRNTGYPVDSDFLSVTVISDNGGLADALSTAIYVGGNDMLEKQITREDIQIIVVDKDKKIYMTKNLKDNFSINEENGKYTLA